MQRRSYVDPALLSKLENMELVARCAVEGFFSGLHPSPFHGFSVEYSDHRDYQPGDELKFLDWKMFGRSDKLHIKQFKQETNVTVHILLDTSMSMSFKGTGAVSKLEYGSYLAAALSYLLLGQNDSTGLVTFADTIVSFIPPRSRRTHLHAILTALQNTVPKGQTRLDHVLHTVAETIKRRGLIILISDLLDDLDDVIKGLAHLRYFGHDVILYHTLDHQEMFLEYDGMVQFEDMESTRAVRAFPQSIKASYEKRVQEFIDQVKDTTGKSRVDYCLMDTTAPLDKALLAYLAKRKLMM